MPLSPRPPIFTGSWKKNWSTSTKGLIRHQCWTGSERTVNWLCFLDHPVDHHLPFTSSCMHVHVSVMCLFFCVSSVYTNYGLWVKVFDSSPPCRSPASALPWCYEATLEECVYISGFGARPAAPGVTCAHMSMPLIVKDYLLIYGPFHVLTGLSWEEGGGRGEGWM